MTTLSVNLGAEQLADAIGYMTTRVVNALLREDVRSLVSQATWVNQNAVPFDDQLAHSIEADGWLRCRQFDGGELWIPVNKSDFMQTWQSVNGAMLWYQPTSMQTQWMNDFDAVLTRLSHDLAPDEAAYFEAYREECHTAVEHRLACEKTRASWFDKLNATNHPWPTGLSWEDRFLFYDRLASCLDHPFFPTARAKLGLTNRDLQAYAPEFDPVITLNWLALPSDLYHGSQDQSPEFWPSFEAVGLDDSLAVNHVLMPVHPFMWHSGLEGFLAECGLERRIIRAPKPFLKVRPTLSVRTLLIQNRPFTHIKLPLNMSTLGSKNYRTIKPSTIYDGHKVQSLLSELVRQDKWLQGQVLLTNEQEGGHAEQHRFLGFILRRFPTALKDATVVSIASLMAHGSDGRLVIEHLADRFYQGDLHHLVGDYLNLTLRVHLALWLRYGIALESNQQNSMLVLEAGDRPMQLLFKDNDSPRIHAQVLMQAHPDMGERLASLQDQRILVDEELPLAQMFTTITLQLNIAVLIEGLDDRNHGNRDQWYRLVGMKIDLLLQQLQEEGCAIDFARQALLEDETLYAKYLLRAASLESPARTGASAVNKYYGKSVPNFLQVKPIAPRSAE